MTVGVKNTCPEQAVVYDALPGPSRSPLTEKEMRSLLLLTEGLGAGLQWHYCDWAELARAGRLSAADLEARAAKLFDRSTTGALWQARPT